MYVCLCIVCVTVYVPVCRCMCICLFTMALQKTQEDTSLNQDYSFCREYRKNWLTCLKLQCNTNRKTNASIFGFSRDKRGFLPFQLIFLWQECMHMLFIYLFSHINIFQLRLCVRVWVQCRVYSVGTCEHACLCSGACTWYSFIAWSVLFLLLWDSVSQWTGS